MEVVTNQILSKILLAVKHPVLGGHPAFIGVADIAERAPCAGHFTQKWVCGPSEEKYIIVRDKMNCTVRFGNSLFRVPRMY